MGLRCLIVDDETPARQRLRRLLSGLADLEVIGEAGDGLSALEKIAALRPDLVFLDIDLPELDGLAVAEALPLDGPAVIFVTAYDEHALKAFELSAIDYLVKPVARERLQAAVAKVGKGRAPLTATVSTLVAGLDIGTARRMAIRSGAKFVVFDPARVSCILSKDHYSAIQVDGKEILADESLDLLARRFDPRRFLRISRGALINLAFLKELVRQGDRRYLAVLSDPPGLRIPVSRERLAALKEQLGVGT